MTGPEAGGMRRLLPEPAATLDPDQLAALYAHPRPSDGSAWVRANVVATTDGAAVGPDGDSRSISSATDRALLVLLRRAADVVLVGAGTATREGYRPSRTPIAVASTALTLDLDDRLFADPSTILLTSREAAPERRRAVRCQLDVLPGDRVTPAAVVAALRARGLVRVLCEGGPRLLGSVVAAGALDELCLTTSPSLVGGPAARVAHGPTAAPTGLSLASLCTAQGYLFARYVRD